MSMPTQLANLTLDILTDDGRYRMLLLTDSRVHADSGWQPTVQDAYQVLAGPGLAFLGRIADRHLHPLPDA